MDSLGRSQDFVHFKPLSLPSIDLGKLLERKHISIGDMSSFFKMEIDENDLGGEMTFYYGEEAIGFIEYILETKEIIKIELFGNINLRNNDLAPIHRNQFTERLSSKYLGVCSLHNFGTYMFQQLLLFIRKTYPETKQITLQAMKGSEGFYLSLGFTIGKEGKFIYNLHYTSLEIV